MPTPKILLVDIETAPALVYVWNQWKTNVIDTKEDWYMLGFAWKWYSHPEPQGFAPNWEQKGRRRGDDRSLVKKLWALFDEADIVVAHNGDRFDVRKSTARFVVHDLGPPSPYQTIDTKKEVAKVAANYSNSLNELGRLYGMGRKIKHQGFELWLGCMAGRPKEWKQMAEYAKQDLILLERLYEILTPWVTSVNLTHWGGLCKRCGSNLRTKRGFHYTNASKFQTWQCKVCRGYSREIVRTGQAKMR